MVSKGRSEGVSFSSVVVCKRWEVCQEGVWRWTEVVAAVSKTPPYIEEEEEGRSKEVGKEAEILCWKR